MKCRNCNYRMPDEYKFCPKCGSRMSKAKRLRNADNVKTDFGFSNPVSWIGILGISFMGLLLFGDTDYDEIRIYVVIACIVGLAYPICILYRKKLDDEEKTIGWVSTIIGLILSVLISLIIKDNTNEGFLTDFLKASSSKELLILYFVLLLLSSSLSVKYRCLGIATTALLMGFLTPMVLTGIIVLCLIIIALILAYVFSKSDSYNSVGSVSERTVSGNNDSAQSDSFNKTYHYEIQWENEKGYKHDTSRTYSKPVDNETVANDFRSLFWNNGENIRIISVKRVKY